MANQPSTDVPPPGDADLVRQSLRGGRDAFARLIQRYYRPVCAFVLKRVGQPALVEDLVQETFLEAYRAVQNGQVPTTFSSWLFGIAHNRCGKWLRRRRPILFPATEPPDMAVVPFAAVEELEEQQRLLSKLDASLATLPDETRELLRMKHQEGKTCDQIAVELGRPVGTIKSQLARAYQSLRVHLKGSLGRTDL
jgi:RNA polymerase sigma-70 factor, ECF subfamily